ncbi:MAG TPA: flagellar motor stator protein MotA [Alphaproteobacteria bacterium]|nr:flagellar motor stator protein MotA [Alphaproteobacteria bacterium]USO06050.1 MAG: flagellar motor stator protein MotA [Rhodospirillales bacterium]HOO81358.1 flagellar motor stator protein MotA [Alphaproteobacteria bacterium]
MKFVGIALVFVCTFGGLLIAMHFDMPKFMKLVMLILGAMPGEFVIIFGCAVAAFLIANSTETIKGTMKYFSALAKPSAYSKDDYVELMSMLFTVFKLARTKGWLALEQHIEQPEESDVFAQFPSFQHNHHALIFLCDYLRIISLGNDSPHELEALMDEEIETIEHHEGHPGHAVQTMADGIPALGIVAAVLGVIKTMASISEPPEVLGKMIGGALVGTFLGVWLSYGMVAPIAGAMTSKAETQVMYFKCIKVAVIAFLNGAAPQVAVEFARKFLPHDIQPTFQELEEKLNELPSPGA